MLEKRRKHCLQKQGCFIFGVKISHAASGASTVARRGDGGVRCWFFSSSRAVDVPRIVFWVTLGNRAELKTRNLHIPGAASGFKSYHPHQIIQ
jgi:hypothetical protein